MSSIEELKFKSILSLMDIAFYKQVKYSSGMEKAQYSILKHLYKLSKSYKLSDREIAIYLENILKII